MSMFVSRGSRVDLIDALDKNISTTLGPNTYIIDKDVHGHFLKQVDNLEMTGKVYGSSNKVADRIARTFIDRTVGTGVMLVGEKGSGKTLIMKLLSMRMRDLGYPTILINHAYHDDDFKLFMQGINEPCMVLFDEFEKVFDRSQQENLLTLLDGTVGSKKLYVITGNNANRIDDNMINRPGRFFYMMTFGGLSDEQIREYCDDRLDDKTQIENVIEFVSSFEVMNFDMLSALVEEMNRYGEDATTAARLLNISTEEFTFLYKVTSFTPDKEFHHTVTLGEYVNNSSFIYPMEDDIYIKYEIDKDINEEHDDEMLEGLSSSLSSSGKIPRHRSWTEVMHVDNEYLVSSKDGTYTYIIPKVGILTISRVKPTRKKFFNVNNF